MLHERTAQEWRVVQCFFHKGTKICLHSSDLSQPVWSRHTHCPCFAELFFPHSTRDHTGFPHPTDAPGDDWGFFCFEAPLASGTDKYMIPCFVSVRNKAEWLVQCIWCMGYCIRREGSALQLFKASFEGNIRQESAGAWGLLYLIKWLNNHYRIVGLSTAFGSSLGGTERLICWVSIFSLDIK